MKKTYLLLTIIVALLLTGCTKKNDEEFVLEQPIDVPVILNNLPYKEYLKLSNPVLTIKVKDIGEMKIQLFPDLAPNTVNSILLYAEAGSYEGVIFHRVIDEFVIQGGIIPDACDIPGEMTELHSENTLLHYRGVISMARVGTLLDSASSQFFIVHENAHSLDNDYAGFGGLIDGFEVLDYIASLEYGDTNVPVVDIIIESMTVELNGYETSDRICVED
jgi:peptidyl-prolyl cis-trans isomerase B (cyclophilin B)